MLLQILHVNGNLIASIVNMDVHDVENLVAVVKGPQLSRRMALQACVIIDLDRLKLDISHLAVLDIRDGLRVRVVSDNIVFHQLVN